MKKYILAALLVLSFVGYVYAGMIIQSTASEEGATNYLNDANCVAAFYMNVNNSTEVERSGNGSDLAENSGSMPTSSTVPSGYSGNSRDFEVSETEALRQADGLSTDISGTAMSFCAWGKLESDTNDANVIIMKYSTSSQRQYMFQFDDGDNCMEVILGYNNGDSFQKAQGDTTRATLSTDWHHHCFVYNGTDIRIYLDGVLDANTDSAVCSGDDNPCAFTESISNESQMVYVGNSPNVSDGWDGLMDELIMFDRALSAAEILEIYTYGIDGENGADD